MGRKVNLIGQTFNNLTVIEETAERTASGSIKWLCRCACGNTTTATGTDLKSGHKKSCGCLNKKQIAQVGRLNAIDLTGQRFGSLVVLKKGKTQILPSGARKLHWICKCDCGSIVSIAAQSLKTGNTMSCGCIKSRGEALIARLLTDNNIPFEREKTFSDGISPRGGYYRFDFLVNGQYIIEYDGKQHFEDYSWGSESYTKEQSQMVDEEKNQYCREHNIPIIRIPYTCYDNLTLQDLSLETTQFLI